MTIDERESRVLSVLLRRGPRSRQELHAELGLRPNTVGDLAERMLRRGLLREAAAVSNGPGRPRVPLEIDPDRRRVAGVALEPGRVSVVAMNLCGQRLGAVARRAVRGERGVAVAGKLLAGALDDSVLVVGASVTGFVDQAGHRLLLSSAAPRGRPISLDPLYDAAGDRRLVVENDLQALAVQWMLTHEAETGEDILLVYVRDGAIGAAVLVNGRPIRGCIMGGNELGHTRLPVDAPRCYCGGRGCLERIFSTAYLRKRGDRRQLTEAVASAARSDALDEAMQHLATGIGNAVNLLRPRRLVLASPFNPHAAFTNRLVAMLLKAMLPTLAERVRIDLWDRAEVEFAEAAGWLALASLYRREWVMNGSGA